MRAALVSLLLASLPVHGPRLEVSPSLPRAGEPFRVRAVDAAGAAAPGVEVELRDAGDARVAQASTSAEGDTEFVVATPGDYTLHWLPARDLRVIVPLSVDAPAGSRLLLSLWTIPVGLLLGWAALRRGGDRVATDADAGHAALNPGPSRSAGGPSADPGCR